MKFSIKMVFMVLAAIMYGCDSSKPTADLNGQFPQDVVMKTYTLIVDENYDEALRNFSDEYIEEFMTSRNITFKDYAERPKIEGWKKEWLKTKLIGNKHNRDVWRVQITPDEGKGKENRASIAHDLYIIEGHWKIVAWMHYPKT